MSSRGEPPNRWPPFAGYGKIAESLEKWGLDAAAHRRLDRLTWTVTEKIHGANVCFAIDGREIRVANRREWLKPGATFYGWEGLRDRLRESLLSAFTVAAREYAPGLRRLYVYGELFGGGYPHPDVPPASGVQPVQTGVWYTPDIAFSGFDMAAEVGTSRRYLDFDTARAVAGEAGVPFAMPLLRGRLTDALNFPLGFDSTLPGRLGLPALTVPNPAEGVVVRPVRETLLTTTAGDTVRALLKRKIPRFAEDERYRQAQKWEAVVPAVAGAGELLRWEVQARLNENRLASAVSKVGVRADRREPSRARTLFRLLVEEVLTEIAADRPDLWADAKTEDRAELRREAEQGVRDLLRRNGGRA